VSELGKSQKFENPDVEKMVLDILKNSPEAPTVGWIAEKLDCCWSTAKILLIDMVRKGKIKIVKTSIGYVFTLNEETKDTPNQPIIPELKKPARCRSCRFYNRFRRACKIDQHPTSADTQSCSQAINIAERRRAY